MIIIQNHMTKRHNGTTGKRLIVHLGYENPNTASFSQFFRKYFENCPKMCNFAPKVGVKMCIPILKVSKKTCSDVQA